MKYLVACALSLTLLAPAVSYAAEPAQDASVVKVRYNDLDLSKSADAAVMLRRVEAAALEACGAADSSLREYRQAVRGSACYDASMSRAVSALNATAVSALYIADANASRGAD